MGTPASAPVAPQDRISEVDIIRGFALFGVLWMNLFSHTWANMPEAHVASLATAGVDRIIGFLGEWLAAGKAQALFSMLFGFGFAILMERVEARGADATSIYLRRLAILLALGLAHLCLLWLGDILHSYALMGFLLLLTRRWPGPVVLTLGIALSLLVLPAVFIGWQLLHPGEAPPWIVAEAAGAERRFALLQGGDFPAFVAENAYAVWTEIYAQPIGPAILAFIFGRFLIGAWIHRRGWLQDTARHAAGFRRWAAILLVSGLLLTAARPALGLAGLQLGDWARRGVFLAAFAGLVVLALGYAAAIVVLCQKEKWRGRLSGLGAVGRMALTNYVTQSLVFLFVLYGFGLGLLPYFGATYCLGLALLVFALQIAFSRWWLERYRFGPLEWVWRSLTYGERQPMRLEPSRAEAMVTP
jgi:uncharacterized protein